ncbi:MAG TPA: hypothetical protein VN033_13830 [Vulgatibacter sp.]|nr:hypothetical protein [Vulgatibacter sp.]
MHRVCVFACAVLLAAACGSDDSPGGGGPASPRCEIDLSPFTAADGAGANPSVRAIAAAADLVGGPAARGQVGDWILTNDRIRVVVQGARDDVGASPFGGTIIDADVIRPAGAGRDVLGGVGPLHGFGRTGRPASAADFEVVASGEAGAAVLAVSAKDVPARSVPIARGLDETLPSPLAVDPEVELGVNITNYYILTAGAQRVRMVTAFCNPSDVPRVLAVGDVVSPGAADERFEPTDRGWSRADGVSDAPWIAYQGGDSAFALVPGNGAGPNVVWSEGGIDVTIQGADSLLPYTRPFDASLPPGGAVVVPGGASAWYERSLVIGSSVGDVSQAIFAARGEELGRVSGTVTGGFDGGAGARILVTREGEVVTVLTADAGRAFDALLPAGTYALSASLPGMIGPEVEVEVVAGDTATPMLDLPVAGRLEVRIDEFDPRLSDAVPAPGRAVIRCFAETCDLRPDPARERLFREVEALPAAASDVVWVGNSTGRGSLFVDLLPGEYEVIFSNGPEYEVSPLSFANNGRGNPRTIVGGEEAKVVARLARVVDTTGWIAADLRVRTQDARVSGRDRIASLLAQGVEVAISADPDVVTDLKEAANQAEAGARIAILGGAGIAPPSFTGIHAFPLAFDPALPGNGAIPWAAADHLVLAPDAIFAQAAGRGALVQVSGARGPRGLFTALKLDTRTLTTHATPESLRIAPSEDGLFSARFDALEVLDGGDLSNFNALLNDWITFLGRGLAVTGTASSGSTGRLSPTAGAPRTWVRMQEDKPQLFDAGAFTEALRSQRATAGYGPFLHVTARAGDATAEVGEVLESAGGEVEIEVVAQSPTWMKYNRLEVYTYGPESAAADGVPNDVLPEVALQPDDLPARRVLSMNGTVYNVEVSFLDEEGQVVTRVRNEVAQTFRFKPEHDTFYIVVARTATTRRDGLESGEPAPGPMAPVVFADPGQEAYPTTFANPIFVDVDGGGWSPPGLD